MPASQNNAALKRRGARWGDPALSGMGIHDSSIFDHTVSDSGVTSQAWTTPLSRPRAFGRRAHTGQRLLNGPWLTLAVFHLLQFRVRQPQDLGRITLKALLALNAPLSTMYWKALQTEKTHEQCNGIVPSAMHCRAEEYPVDGSPSEKLTWCIYPVTCLGTEQCQMPKNLNAKQSGSGSR